MPVITSDQLIEAHTHQDLAFAFLELLSVAHDLYNGLKEHESCELCCVPDHTGLCGRCDTLLTYDYFARLNPLEMAAIMAEDAMCEAGIGRTSK